MADRKISDLTALTTPASGDFLPIVDISEVAAASKNKRITIEELFRGVPLGTAAAPSIAIEGDEDTGVFSPGANQLAISTNGVQRINIEADGDINIDSGGVFYDATNNRLAIGTTSPDELLHVQGNARFSGTTTAGSFLSVVPNNTGSNGARLVVSYYGSGSYGPLEFWTGGSQRAQIDASGRLLVGTSTARGIGGGVTSAVQIEAATDFNKAALSIVSNANNNSGSYILLGKSRAGALNGSTIVQDNDLLGDIRFAGADGTDLETVSARIFAEVDGTPGTNDMPGRLVFATTADGTATVTERLRITSAGVLQVADAGNITVGTTTGTKIGTATTQKIGFYNATPVVQPAAVADATTAVDVITQLNDLLAKLRTLGIIAT
jgi:hypothetical protein